MHSIKSVGMPLLLLLMTAGLLSGSCGGSGRAMVGSGSCIQPTGDSPSPDVVPDFRLRDTNLNSSTAYACVSPRNFLTRVSAWYLGHTT